MSDNKRIYYASKGLAIKKSGTANNRSVIALSASGVTPNDEWEVPRGVQSVGVTTTFNTEDVLQQGQLALYERVEDRPEVELTLSRVLDGSKPVFLMASNDQGQGRNAALGLSERFDAYSVDIALAIYNEDVKHASGVAGRPAVSRMLCSGMFLSSATFTFPTEGNATEEINFVGNNKYWSVDSTVAGSAPLSSFPDENLISTDENPTAFVHGDGRVGGVTRREDVLLHNETIGSTFAHQAKFPTEIPSNDRDCIQNVTVSVDLGQAEILCLGSKTAQTRYVEFPVEVTASFEVTTSDGDMIEGHETSELSSQEIVIVTRQGLRINLGSNNKLNSIDFTGGDTGGGNVTVTYNYSNSNELTLSHYGFS